MAEIAPEDYEKRWEQLVEDFAASRPHNGMPLNERWGPTLVATETVSSRRPHTVLKQDTQECRPPAPTDSSPSPHKSFSEQFRKRGRLPLICLTVGAMAATTILECIPSGSRAADPTPAEIRNAALLDAQALRATRSCAVELLAEANMVDRLHTTGGDTSQYAPASNYFKAVVTARAEHIPCTAAPPTVDSYTMMVKGMKVVVTGSAVTASAAAATSLLDYGYNASDGCTSSGQEVIQQAYTALPPEATRNRAALEALQAVARQSCLTE